MKYASIPFFLLSAAFFSPVLVGIFDMFWWFWTNATWSDIEYGTSARPLVMLFFCVPAVASAGVGCMVLDVADEQNKFKALREKING